MQRALYTPELGYYQSTRPKLGKYGDFVTAPELGALFAKSLANQCCDILTQIGGGEILELGAGSGQLAHDLITQLSTLNAPLNAYKILELSQHLTHCQQQKLQHHSVSWLTTLPSDFKGIIIANEVIDALPIHCLLCTDNQIVERGVSVENQQLVWKAMPLSPSLERQIQQQGFNALTTYPHYQTELSQLTIPWVQSLQDTLSEGVILLMDYGFDRQTFYQVDRHMGTLMCHYKHQSHTDPFFYQVYKTSQHMLILHK